jgi:signal transduction histidine kinase
VIILGFSVQDTGLGFFLKIATSFTRFRGRAAHELNAQGTGPGLAIAKIIGRHGGCPRFTARGYPRRSHFPCCGFALIRSHRPANRNCLCPICK